MLHTPSRFLQQTLLVAGCALAGPAIAQDEGPPAPVAYFYEALRNSDRAMMGVILSDEVVIVLQDLGIEQSKTEFIAALDEWESLSEDVVIDVTLLESGVNAVTVEVCYDMGESQQLTEEHFEIDNEKIISLSQATIAENCDGTSKA